MMTTILYNKYRPRSFKDVIRQDFICKILQKQLDNNSIGNCYIFCGPAGTGKTSVARVLASQLLEDDSDLIFQGKHPDLYEINCSENNGIDHARELIIDRSKNSPVKSKYKIFILDEAQGLTPQAQKALLKMFEEPPKHVIFMLCTTDLPKIVEAIQTRSQIFTLKAIKDSEIMDALQHICEQESYKFDIEALEIMARFSYGSLRSAISSLQQLSDIGLTTENITEFYQTSPIKDAIDVLSCLANKDSAALFLKIKTLSDNNVNLYDLITNINKTLLDLIDIKVAKNISKHRFVLDLEPKLSGQQVLKIASVTKECLKESKQSLALDFILQTQFLSLIPRL